MDLRTLYFVGQRVFFAQLGVIEEVEIKEIYLTVSDRGGIDLFSSKGDLLNALAGDEFAVVPLKN